MATNETNTTDTGNDQAIGKAVVVSGLVQVESPDGATRLLQVNGLVFANETILTGSTGKVSIIFNDAAATRLDLGRMSEVVLDGDVYPGDQTVDISEVTSEVEQLQEALLEGDPTQELPAPAAGPAAGETGARGGGHPTAVFELTGEEVTPTSGAETIGISRDFLEPERYTSEEIIIEPEVVEPPEEEIIPPPDFAPVAGDHSAVIDEANFPDGTEPVGTPLTVSGDLTTLGIDFGGNGPGSISINGQTIAIDNLGGTADTSITVAGSYGSLQFWDNGTWTYSLTTNISHPLPNTTGAGDSLPDPFDFIVFDSDGDSATGTLTINILDDGPEVTDLILTRVVEEEALDNYLSGDPNVVGSSGNPDENDGPEDSDFNTFFQNDAAQVSGSLTPLVTMGADNPGTFTWGSLLDLPPLSSQGGQVTYELNGNGTTLEAWVRGDVTGGDGDRLVFTLDLQPDGSYTFTLLDQLDHVTADGENSALQLWGTAGGSLETLDLSSAVIATDSDLDTTGLTPGSLSFYIVDDVPVAAIETEGVQAQVLEDGLSIQSGDAGDLSEGNREAGETTADDEASGGIGSLTQLFQAGSDELTALTGSALTLGITTDQTILDGLAPLMSQGEAVTYSSDGTTLTATAGGREVFHLTVNADGSWNFDLDDQLDHVDDGANDENWLLQGNGAEPGIDFSAILTAEDFDGDMVTGAATGGFIIEIQDDIPIAVVDTEGVSAQVLEDGLSILGGDAGDLSEGNREAGETTADDEASGGIGSLTQLFQVGADEDAPPAPPLTLGITTDQTILDGLAPLMSQGEAVTYSSDGTTLTATAGGREVFHLTVNADGSWNFDLDDQLDHVDDGANDENWLLQGNGAEPGIDFSAILTAEDFDGDMVTGAATGGFIIEIQDDIPIAVVDTEGVSAQVLEDGLSILGGDAGDLSEGNREAGETTADDEASGGIGSLTQLFQVGADEDAPPAPPLTLGITTDQTILDGLAPLMSQGEAVTYSSDGTTLTATAGGREVFHLTVNADGSWNFDLDDQLDHVDDGANDENWLLQGNGAEPGIDFSAILTAEDFDGDMVTGAATGGFIIEIQDDIPIAVVDTEGVSAQVLEDGLSILGGDAGDLSEGNREAGETTADDEASGGIGSLTQLFQVGADEDAPPAPPLTLGITTDQTILDGLAPLMSQGEAVTYSSDGTTLTATAGGREVFHLTVNADGSWNFDLDDQLDHVDDGANDENWLLQGNGAEPGIDFSAILTAEDFDGDMVTGAATGAFVIEIQDDIPIAVVETEGVSAQVLEDGLSIQSGDAGDLSEGNREAGETTADDEASGGIGSLTQLFLVGADEDAPPAPPLTLGITTDQTILDGLAPLMSQGEAVTYSSDGTTLTATAGGREVFHLTVNADGSWNFDLDDQLDHVDDGANDENWLLQGNGAEPGIDFSAILTAEDFDGDMVTGAATGGFIIEIQDDIPIAVVDTEGVSAQVLEDGLSILGGDAGDLSEGNREAGETTADDEASGGIGSLTQLFLVGADEDAPPAPPLTLGITTDQTILDGLAPLMSQGEAVTYSSDGTTLTATAGGREVFHLTVNADGSWNFDLDDQLDHVDDGANDENWLLQGNGAEPGIDFSAILTAEDFDGDMVTGAATGAFVIEIQDDIPIAVVETEGVRAQVLEDGLSILSGDAGDLSEGNREAGETTADDEASGGIGSLTQLFLVGADEDAPPAPPLTLGITTDQTILDGLAPLMSQGEAVTYSSDGTTLTATAGGREVFHLTVNADGSWNFDLDDQLDHVDDGANDENWLLQGNGAEPGIDFSAILTAEDFDGDMVTGAATGGFIIEIQDDIPIGVVETEGVRAQVLEDGLSILSGDAGDLSEGNREAGETTADDEASGGIGSLTQLFLVGADEDAPPAPPLTLGITTDQTILDGLAPLMSQGEAVTYSSDGATLTATAGGREVFHLTVNGDGSWNFDLDDQLDHVDDGANDENWLLQGNGAEPGIDFSAILTAEDFDGDMVTGAATGGFIIEIQDDIPIAVVETEGVRAQVLEDGLSILSGDAGDLSEGNREAGETTADDEASGGIGSLTQLFLVGADEDAPPAPPLTLGITTDQTILDGLAPLMSQGEAVTYSSDGTTLTATAGGREVFHLTVNADGSWNFDLDDQLDHVDDGANDENWLLQGNGAEPGIDFSAILTAEDFDGDMVTGAATGGFIIEIQDDIPVLVAEPYLTSTVFEDGLDSGAGDYSDGIGGGVTDATVILSTLVESGADEELTYSLLDTLTYQPTTLTSGGKTVTYSVAGNVLTAATVDNTVFTFTIVDPLTGEANFDLVDQLDHTLGSEGTDADILTISDLGQFVQATDADGDSVNFGDSLIINIENDVPEIGEVSNAFIANEPNMLLTGIFDVEDGADEVATADLSSNVTNLPTWDGTSNYANSGLTSLGQPVYYYVDPSNPSVLLGVTDPADPTNSLVFTLTVDPVNDQYTLETAAKLDGEKEFNIDLTSTSYPGGPADQYLITDQNNAYFTPAEVPAGETVILTVTSVNPAADDVQGSNIGIGIDDQWVEMFPEDSPMIIDFGQPGLDGTLAIGGEISIGVDIKANSTVTIQYIVYDENGNAVDSNGDPLTTAFTGETTLTGKSGVLEVDGFDQVSSIDLTPSDGAFRVNSIEFAATSTEFDVLEDFTVEITDADGDIDTATISVEFDSDNEMIGTDDNDVFVGGPEDETIIGGAGDDVMEGGGGNDILVGGTGEDMLSGGEGDDTLFGGDDNDELHGDAGNDELVGGEGDDIMEGGDDDDTLFGGDETGADGAGTDTLTGDTIGDPSDTGSDTFVDAGGDTITDLDAGEGDDIDDLIPPPTEPIV